MAGKIFLNYRRDDDAGTVGRLFDRLENAFGKSNIFMDVEGHIKAGDDYVDVLRAQVDACDVLLAVIGPRWLTITDDNDRRRLDNPDDWVRIEIAKALEAGISKRVIPVLAPAGAMPRAGDLPADLAALARKQAVRITLDRFNSDAQGLIDQIRGVLDDLETAKAASEAERAAAEAAQRKRESEEQAKQEAIEARARAWLISGLSPEEVRKAEELANWDYVKARADIDEVRDHLARFPDSVITKPYAQARLAELTWSRLTARSAIEELRAFVEAFPTSEHCAEAQHWIESAEARVADERASAERRAAETEAWSAVASSTDKAVIEAFIRAWPNGAHAGHAQARLKELRGNLGGSHILVRALAYASVVTIVAGALIFLGQPVWQLASVQSLPTLIGHPCCVSSVVFAPDGKTALSATHSGVMKVWDIATRKELRTFSPKFPGYQS